MKKAQRLKIEDNDILVRVEEDKYKDEQDSETYRDNRKLHDEQVRALESKEDDRPYNVKLPLTKIALRGLKARIMALLKKKRTFKPTEENDVKKVTVSEDFYEWVRNTLMADRYFKAMDLATLVLLGEGVVITRPLWDRREGKTVEFKYYDVMMYDQAVNIEREIEQDDIIRDVLPESENLKIVQPIKEIGEDRIRVDYERHVANQPEQKQWKKERLEIDFSIDESIINGQPANRIIARIEKPEVKYEGPIVNVENFDAIFFPVDSDDLQENDHVIIQFKVPAHELLRKRDQGIYHFSDDDFEAIKRSSVDVKPVDSDTVEMEEKDIEGTVDADPPPNSVLIEGYEAYYLWDIEGKGYQEQVIFTVIPAAKKVIRKKYLNEVFYHGERPLVYGIWELRKHRLLGIGLPEDLEPLQCLINDIINCILNASAQAMNPPGFYDPANAQGKKEKIKYQYGELIPIPGNSIQWIPFPANFPVGFELLSFFVDLFQREAVTSDQVQGQPGGVKTATATMKLLQEAYQNMSLNIERVVQFIKQMDIQIWKLCMAYMPGEIIYRVMGPQQEYEFKTISKSDLIMSPDISLEIDIAETSKEYVQQVAMQIFESISTNPLLIQMGVVNPSKSHAGCKNLLQAFGQKDYQNYLSEPQNLESKDPDEENYQMAEGQNIPPMPMDDDQYHMQVHMTFKEQAINLIPMEEYLNVMIRVDNHIALHQQQQQIKALQQQLAIEQAANMAQQQRGQNKAKNSETEGQQGKTTGMVSPGQNSPFLNVRMPGMGTV